MLKKSILTILTITTMLHANSSYAVSKDKDDNCKKETMQVEITNGRIEVMSGITYSQIYSGGRCRQLKMTLLLPKDRAPQTCCHLLSGWWLYFGQPRKVYRDAYGTGEGRLCCGIGRV